MQEDFAKKNSGVPETCFPYWIVDLRAEKQMAERVAGGTASARDSEDHLYLQSIKGCDRRGTLGSFDTKLAKRYERSARENLSLQTKRPSSSEEPLSKRRKEWDESCGEWQPGALTEEVEDPFMGDIPVEVNYQRT